MNNKFDILKDEDTCDESLPTVSLYYYNICIISYFLNKHN